MLAISKADRRKKFNPNWAGILDATRHQMEPPKAKEKYMELKNFEMEVTNIFSTKQYNLYVPEKKFYNEN